MGHIQSLHTKGVSGRLLTLGCGLRIAHNGYYLLFVETNQRVGMKLTFLEDLYYQYRGLGDIANDDLVRKISLIMS